MGITWFQFHRGTDILESPCMAKKNKRESITQYSFITLGSRLDSMIAPFEYIHDLKIWNHLVTVQK